jgi:hypothetical protein
MDGVVGELLDGSQNLLHRAMWWKGGGVEVCNDELLNMYR